MSELTPAERDVVIEASHPSRPDREALLVAAVERILAERIAEARREGAAEAWDQGMRTGASRAMRHMSDEPTLPLATEVDNPYRGDA